MVGQAGRWWRGAVICLCMVESYKLIDVDGDGIIGYSVPTVPSWRVLGGMSAKEGAA